MADFFFYGTLCHVPLLEKVLGYRPQLREAWLPDFQTYWAKDASYPVILAQSGAKAYGLLAQGLSLQDVAKLDFYESGFGYQTYAISITHNDCLVSAQVYFSDHIAEIGPLWSLDDWTAQWAELVLAAADEFMAHMGKTPPSKLTKHYPMMLARAASALRARDGQNESHGLRHFAQPGDIGVESRAQPYSAFFAVEDYKLNFKGMGQPPLKDVERTVFITSDAVTVLPYDPVADLVMVIEQFRPGPFARGDQQPWLLETISGRIDAGETAQAAALRESQEEAGLSINALLPIGQSYPSAGCMSEFLYSFVGLADLAQTQTGIFGLKSEDEIIKTHILPFDQLIALIAKGEINTSPLILSAFWLQNKRQALMEKACLA